MNDQEYEKNPIFLFAHADAELLEEIVAGRIDCRVMASQELENRGYVIVGARKLYKSYDHQGNPISVTIPE